MTYVHKYYKKTVKQTNYINPNLTKTIRRFIINLCSGYQLMEGHDATIFSLPLAQSNAINFLHRHQITCPNCFSERKKKNLVYSTHHFPTRLIHVFKIKLPFKYVASKSYKCDYITFWEVWLP